MPLTGSIHTEKLLYVTALDKYNNTQMADCISFQCSNNCSARYYSVTSVQLLSMLIAITFIILAGLNMFGIKKLILLF